MSRSIRDIAQNRTAVAVSVTALIIGGWFLYRGLSLDSPEPSQSGARVIEGDIPDEPASKVRIVATGDMIAHDSVIENARLADGGYDFYQFMDGMAPYFGRADVRFCNLATPAGGGEFGISGYPVFNAPLEFNTALEKVGCNVVNLGTNHTNDKGQPLIDAMVTDWQSREGILATAGAHRSAEERDQISYFESGGLRFAFLSYSTYSNDMNLTPYGLVMYDAAVAQREIAEAKAEADFVIVSMRWGVEYAGDVDARQDAIAQDVVDAGADFVFGHGPHVLQPVKQLTAADGREATVWYSLGNFMNTQIPIETLTGGFATMDIDIATREVTLAGFLPVYMHYEWTEEEAARQDLLARNNLEMVLLENAQPLLDRSVHSTSVAQQTARIQRVLNRYLEVPIIDAATYDRH
jgi:poly-gamma-glutamate capsule biosynthesis protein CapA/YwtB (metallophosphatase superfamily)